jgi:hypothetical protein
VGDDVLRWVHKLRAALGGEVTPGDFADCLEDFLGDKPSNGWGWDDFEYSAWRSKDPEIKAILDDGIALGAFLEPQQYANNDAACDALRTVVRRLREVQAIRDRRNEGK